MSVSVYNVSKCSNGAVDNQWTSSFGILFCFYWWGRKWECVCVCVCVCVRARMCTLSSVAPNSLLPHGLQPTSTRLLCSWNSPGKNTGVDCHFLLQGIFPTQVTNLRLLFRQVKSLPLHHLGSPGSECYWRTNGQAAKVISVHSNQMKPQLKNPSLKSHEIQSFLLNSSNLHSYSAPMNKKWKFLSAVVKVVRNL